MCLPSSLKVKLLCLVILWSQMDSRLVALSAHVKHESGLERRPHLGHELQPITTCTSCIAVDVAMEVWWQSYPQEAS